MKTKIENPEVLAPNAEGNAIARQVKTEITFLWEEADEWKPVMEAREIIEDNAPARKEKSQKNTPTHHEQESKWKIPVRLKELLARSKAGSL